MGAGVGIDQKGLLVIIDCGKVCKANVREAGDPIEIEIITNLGYVSNEI